MTALAVIDRHIATLTDELDAYLLALRTAAGAETPNLHNLDQLGLQIATLQGKIQGLTIAKIELETAQAAKTPFQEAMTYTAEEFAARQAQVEYAEDAETAHERELERSIAEHDRQMDAEHA